MTSGEREQEKDYEELNGMKKIGTWDEKGHRKKKRSLRERIGRMVDR